MDWHRIFFNDQPSAFFLEIIIRTVIMFLAVVLLLRLAGKRGIQQLSIFEMVMIITLGSAAGDSMFYEDVGLFHALMVFLVILILYRLIALLIAKSEKVEKVLEGEPEYIIKEGKICIENINSFELGADEFLSELRSFNVEHLGQLRYVILEDSGKLSAFYYEDEKIKPGLPILPHEFCKKSEKVKISGLYACARCGDTQHHEPSESIKCGRCEHIELVKAINRRRIT